MKKRFIGWLIVFVVLILVGMFIYIGKKEENKFNVFIQSVNEERENVHKNLEKPDIKDYQFKVKGDKAGFLDEEIEVLLKYREEKQGKITKEEAIEDTEYLFKILEYAYGARGYYDDELFIKGRWGVLNRIYEMKEVTVEEMKSLWAEHLKFITDGHFALGGNIINIEHYQSYYSNEEMEIEKVQDEYYLVQGDDRRLIVSIDGEREIEKFIKRSIDDEGNLVNFIGLLQYDLRAKFQMEIQYKKDSQVIKEDFELKKAFPIRYRNESAFGMEYVEGIPILRLKKLHDRPDETKLKDFVESGLSMKEEDVFIIDLRGNGGGTDIWCDFWFKNYTGMEPLTGKIGMKRYSKLYLYAQRAITGGDSKSMDSQLDSFLSKYEMPELSKTVREYFRHRENAMDIGEYDTWNVDSEEYKRVENDNIIFVLQDKGIASSAEDFLQQLRTMENVIFVGSNTSGCQEVSDIQVYFLPNTNIKLNIGAGFEILREEPYFTDGVGIEPDIWLNNDKLIERLEKMCKRYKLIE